MIGKWFTYKEKSKDSGESYSIFIIKNFSLVAENPHEGGIPLSIGSFGEYKDINWSKYREATKEEYNRIHQWQKDCNYTVAKIIIKYIFEWKI